ncbi:hypothetical protein BM529_01260, partial [Clostridioides difficile]
KGKLDVDFIEVMTCPVGCVSGGGQPKILLEEYKELAYENRTKATYVHDEHLAIRNLMRILILKNCMMNIW